MMKTCNSCGLAKDSNQFHKSKSRKDGLQPKCKVCNIISTRKWQDENQEHIREWYAEIDKEELLLKRRASRYGITVDELVELLETANGRCAICKEEKQLHVDHDHNTGKVRGLLCHLCNRGLGMFKDDLARLEAAKLYLVKH